MNANTAIKSATSASVSIVSVIAAVISYSHIYHVAIGHGQTHLDASLLPFSVDGLIAAASLTLFYASRNRLDSPQLARWMLGLGIAATIGANAVFGISSGWLGILLSAWPAVALIGSVELIIWVIRAATSMRPHGSFPTVRSAHHRTNSKGDEIRQWAREQGYEIGDRGRIPDVIQNAYATAIDSGAELFIPDSFEEEDTVPEPSETVAVGSRPTDERRTAPGPRGTGVQR